MMLKFSEKLVNKELVVSERILDTVSYDLDNIDWDKKATLSPNTFSLFLHCLRPVYYLSMTYAYFGNKIYLQAAEQFIIQWNKYDIENKQKNRYAWHIHSVSERVESLIIYSIVYQEAFGRSCHQLLTTKMINKHNFWLKQEKNYIKQHNYGIFADGALIKAGEYLKDKKILDLGISRLDKQLKYAFPNKNIHIENSTNYHLAVFSYIKRIGEFLSEVDHEYTQIINQYCQGVLEYLIYMYKPSLVAPYIGDTFGTYETNGSMSFSCLHHNNEYLRYVATQGKQGVRPEEATKVFFDDGYAIFREHWRQGDFAQATWLLFKSGYLSSTHKHSDDLSFILYSKGHDIFIDPGMYNYMVGNKIHDYINSSLAHNTIVVDNQSYSIGINNSPKVGLLKYEKKDFYEVVSGYNNIYPNVKIDRNVYYISGDEFLIFDDIVSENTHEYSQTFHLSNDVKIRNLASDELLLETNDGNYYILLTQFINCDEVKRYSGIGNKRLSCASVGLNEIVDTETVTFNTKGKNVKFVTYIKITNTQTNTQENKPLLGAESLDFENFKIPISSRKRVGDFRIKVTSQLNRIEISSDIVEQGNVEHCYYLLEKETSKKEAASWYSKEKTHSFELDTSKEFALISYIRNNSKETERKYRGIISYNANKQMFEFVPIPREEQEPFVAQAVMKRCDNNDYLFSLKIVGGNKINVRWYIYKDGASYGYKESDGVLKYKFTESGNYTIIYKVRDIYFGEFEVNNFPEELVEVV